MRHWRNFILVAVLAALCFGGSFTCKGSTHGGVDDDDSSASVSWR